MSVIGMGPKPERIGRLLRDIQPEKKVGTSIPQQIIRLKRECFRLCIVVTAFVLAVRKPEKEDDDGWTTVRY